MMHNLDPLPLRREEADAYSSPRGLDKWGFRVAWFVVREGPEWARRVCGKHNMKSPARKCYQNLLQAGFIVEGPNGGYIYDAMTKWEFGNGPLRWLEAVAHVAAGGEPDPDLPLNR